MTDEQVERFAKAAHEVWAHWMRYQFSVCHKCEDGSYIIPADKVERWLRQMNTDYGDLPAHEKGSDREVGAMIYETVRLKYEPYVSATIIK